jgi:hypothetical protein
VAASAGSGAAGFGSGVVDGCARERVGDVSACVGECPEGVRRKASTAWPRCEHDVAAALRGWTCTARPWHRQGWGAARKKAGTAMLVSAGACACGTVKVAAAAECEGGASGSCTKMARRPEG